MSVVLKLFAPGVHLGTFSKFAMHLDQSADLDFRPSSVL